MWIGWVRTDPLYLRKSDLSSLLDSGFDPHRRRAYRLPYAVRIGGSDLILCDEEGNQLAPRGQVESR